MEYSELYKHMNKMYMMTWTQFITQSTDNYLNFIEGLLINYKQLSQMSNIIFMREVQKSLKETEKSIAN